MNFYRIETRQRKGDCDTEIDPKKCGEYAEIFYQKSDKKAIVVVEETMTNANTLVTVVRTDMLNQYTPEKIIAEFNEISDMDLCFKNSKEISLDNLKWALRRAEQYGYIESKDKIISDFNLDCDCRCKEFLVNHLNIEEINELSRELLYEKSLLPEIERIYCVKNELTKPYHPVHYIIRSDDVDESREILNCLISALYDNNRLFSKRYSEFDVDDCINGGHHDLRKLYSVHRGGTVVLKFEPSGRLGRTYERGGLCENIEKIARIINKFNHEVLTVFVLPQVCEKETEAIYKKTEPVYVEIVPENASGKRAKEYLNYKARKAEVTATDTLYRGIDDEKALSSRELSEHFANWYSNYVRTEMYPQYAEIKRKKVAENDNRFGKALRELSEMIGLENAKKIVYNALDYYKVQKMYKQLGKRTESPSMHMVFTGNPGTAKTTVARLFAQILKDNDVITNGRFVEVGRADLIGKYVGHTAPLVRHAFEKAAGGVLFIDEAYSLLDDKGGMYGDEAINTIVQEMENRRNETIVIFAGYPNEMEAFLSRNPGLKSRIAFHVPFDDYSPEELVEITKLMAKNKDNIIDESALEKIRGIYNDAVKISDFGNGRYARNMIEKAELNRATRLAKFSFDEVTKDMLETFIPEDFEADKKQVKEEKRIGFL